MLRLFAAFAWRREAFQKDPLWSPLIPNWNRVESALPTFLDEFREAVHADNELSGLTALRNRGAASQTPAFRVGRNAPSMQAQGPDGDDSQKISI